MKYPQSQGPLPRDVEDWLEGELIARGIDGVAYTRHVLSLMLQDTIDLDRLDHPSYPSHSHLASNKAAAWRRWEHTEAATDRSWDHQALKRLAAVRCLVSATGQKSEMESLVDQLSVKLQEIQSGGPAERPSILQSSELPSISSYETSLPHALLEDSDSRRKGETCQAASPWTRGILRATLNENQTIPYEQLSPPYWFPLNYCGANNTSYGNALDIYGPRLYERSANRSLERVMAGLDATFHQFWNPNVASAYPDHIPPTKQQDHTYFQHGPKVATSDVSSHNSNEKSCGGASVWSLGGSKTAGATAPPAVVVPVSGHVAPVEAKLVEEDLLTSDRTHFRPIQSSDSVTKIQDYKDGTTFAISTEIEPLQFQRSESGTLFLEAGKYMEFKDNEETIPGVEEFIPKFRVQQSNEKFCQTDDLGSLHEDGEDDDALTVDSSSAESKLDDFFFPGDQLALELSSDDLPEEGEVAKIVSGRLDVRWKATSKSPSPEFEPEWDAEDEAMVDDLVEDSPSWKPYTLSQYSDTDVDDDLMDYEGSEGWPQLTHSIWNPKSSTRACETCRGGSAAEKQQASDVILSKPEWKEIWKQPFCHRCQVSEIGKVENDVKEDKDSWKWPELGAALSAYLQETRAQTVDLNNFRNLSVLRGLWSGGGEEVWSPLAAPPIKDGKARPHRPRTYIQMRDELCEDGDKLLSDLSCLHLQQYASPSSDSIDTSQRSMQDQDTFSLSSTDVGDEKGAGFVSLWATWNIIAIDGDKSIFERNYDYETAQKERKRRHSSSQKMCELYMEGDCRRAHCRFRHDFSPHMVESVCVTAHPMRTANARELNRAFTF